MAEDSEILRIAIRRSVLANSAVKALISNRFYPGELGLRKNVKYPCANFRVGGGALDSDVKEFKKPNLVIWAWSRNSYDEAYKIYNTIFNVLYNNLLSQNQRSIVCKEDTRPMEAYEPVTETFYLRASWFARMINYT